MRLLIVIITGNNCQNGKKIRKRATLGPELGFSEYSYARKTWRFKMPVVSLGA